MKNRYPAIHNASSPLNISVTYNQSADKLIIVDQYPFLFNAGNRAVNPDMTPVVRHYLFHLSIIYRKARLKSNMHLVRNA